jgi:glycosyltransferase involved in cell wall biosynthesis
MSGRRTLLYLGRDLPVPISGAARLRTYNWLVHLSRRFDVTFVAPVQAPPDETYLDALRPYCVAVYTPMVLPAGRVRRLWARVAAEARYWAGGGPPELFYLQHGAPRALVADLARRTRFDVVFAERWSWGERACHLGTSAVLDAGALQSPRVDIALRASRNPMRRLLRTWLLQSTSRLEARVLSRYGLVLTHSHVEERQVTELCADARAVSLPAGLDVRYFEPSRADVDPTNVVFYGALDGPAQRDALVHLQHDIMPVVRERLRDAVLTVVDAAPVAELQAALTAGEPVAFTGPIDDVREPLRRAAVAAMPLRFGTGSRSRLAQLLALGVPVVATPQAARGLGLRSGDGVVIAAAGPEFARVLGDVLLDTSLRDDLSQRGRATAETQYSIAATYELLSEQLAAGPEAP